MHLRIDDAYIILCNRVKVHIKFVSFFPSLNYPYRCITSIKIVLDIIFVLPEMPTLH